MKKSMRIVMIKTATLGMAALYMTVLAGATPAMATQVKIVGSSTVSKFARTAERRLTAAGADVTIETTGTSGGFSLFCESHDPSFASVTMASRRMKDIERQTCDDHQQGEILEYDLGLSGVVIAEKRGRRPMRLRREDIFLALAAKTPVSDSDCALQNNPRTHWSDVRRDLPNRPIEVFGPPITSGTRASFVGLAMRAGALRIGCMKALQERDRAAFRQAVRSLRKDGAWVDAGENDSGVIAAVKTMPHALGVIGYPVFLVNKKRLTASIIDGSAPNAKTIADRSYVLSRILRVYAKASALEVNAAARAFIEEITSAEAIGAGGYLAEEGLIPFTDENVE